MTDTWTVGGTTYNGIAMNVTNTAYAAASQLMKLSTSGTARFGVRAPHNALGADTTPFLSMTDVWNTSGAVVGIQYNTTDTASSASSLLMDLQVGGVSKTKVDKSGVMTVVGQIACAGTGSDCISAGSGAAGQTRYITVNGGAVNSADGAGFRVQANSVTTTQYGNRSGILGGAYNAQTTIYSANGIEFMSSTFATTFKSYNDGGVALGGATDPGLGLIKTKLLTVSTLPAAATAGNGARAYVTDALGPVFGSTVAAGGAVSVPVYSDGTNWKVG
jgi:hypothetical protein